MNIHVAELAIGVYGGVGWAACTIQGELALVSIGKSNAASWVENGKDICGVSVKLPHRTFLTVVGRGVEPIGLRMRTYNNISDDFCLVRPIRMQMLGR